MLIDQPFSCRAPMKKMNDKRRHDRFEFQKRIHVFPVLPSKSGNIYEVQKDSFEAHSSNLSEGGLGLETAKPLNPDFLLKVNFELQSDQAMEVYGKVVWSRQNHCGIRFMYTDASLRRGIKFLAQEKTAAGR